MDCVTENKGGGYESPSRDRLLFLTTSLIGQIVEVQVKNGSIFTGIFHATSAEKEIGMFGMLLSQYASWFARSSIFQIKLFLPSSMGIQLLFP